MGTVRCHTVVDRRTVWPPPIDQPWVRVEYPPRRCSSFGFLPHFSRARSSRLVTAAILCCHSLSDGVLGNTANRSPSLFVIRMVSLFKRRVSVKQAVRWTITCSPAVPFHQLPNAALPVKVLQPPGCLVLHVLTQPFSRISSTCRDSALFFWREASA